MCLNYLSHLNSFLTQYPVHTCHFIFIPLSRILLYAHVQLIELQRIKFITHKKKVYIEGGHCSPADNVLGGQNSLVNVVREDMSRGTPHTRTTAPRKCSTIDYNPVTLGSQNQGAVYAT